MPRYVVLEHAMPAGSARGRHWDFMLEAGAALRTWAIEQAPDSGGVLEALALADHRLAYLEYEGPISGDRGSVTRWDEGTYQILSESEGTILLDLSGRRLRGRALLRPDPQDAQRVMFSLESDGSAA